jgi:uncharacterized protein YndB with AHSA1/START domain
MRLDISMQELFPVPVARVWHALTDSQMINRWLMSTRTSKRRSGRASRFARSRDAVCAATSNARCSNSHRRIAWSGPG